MLENMASVTLENSYVSTGKDMGKSHEKAHSKQRKYLQKDEPNIVTLTSNKSEDSSVDLAMKMAVKMGVKDEDEWEEYNSKLRKDRRKDSYEEYLAGVSGNLVKNKRRKLADKKHILSKSKREQIAQELAYIDNNKGIPIDGSLYYISNSLTYDNMKPAELKKYREFERATLTDFYNSKTFKELNPQNIRSEIHFDENGAIHLQTQNVWYHKDKRGRMTYAKRAEIKKILTKKYGSEQRLNNYLDVLSYCHEKFDQPKDRIGSPTVASKFWYALNKIGEGVEVAKETKVDDEGNEYPFKYTQAERTTRIEELWRMEQQKTLAAIAEQKAKEMGINWTLDTTYTTDGIHRNGSNYVEHKRSLAQTNTELAHKQDELADTQSIVKQAQEALRASYKQLTGKDAVNDKNEPMSPLECSKAINRVIEDKKQEKDQVDNDVNTAKQKAEQQRKLADEQQNRLNELNNSIKQANDEFDDVNKKIQEKQETAELIYKGLSSSNKALKSENDELTVKNDDLQQKAEQKQAEVEAKMKQFNEAKSQLAIVKQQKKDEEEKLNKLRLKRRQQQQLEAKADQYDQIKNFMGNVPENHTLASWVKNQFEFVQKQAKIGFDAILNAEKLQKALTHNMNMNGEVADKDVKTFENQTSQTTNVLVKFVEEKYKQFKQKHKIKQQQRNAVRNNTDGPDGVSR